MSPYEFVFKLHDLFTSPLTRIASNYNRVTGEMQRRAQVVSRVFAPVGAAMRRSFTAPQGTVAELTKQLDLLREKAKNIDIRVDRRGLIDANREIQWLERRIDKLQGMGTKRGRGGGGGGMGSWLMAGGMAAGVAYGVYNTAEAAIGKTVAPAMQMEATKFQLAAMLKSKDSANNLVNQVNAYAPSQSTDLLMAGRSLLGAGVKEKDLMNGLKTLNNLAAFSNTDVKELAIIQAKIKATGYVQGDEKDMLVERGININKYLAQVMGIKETQIKKAQEKGLITYDIFQKALERMAGQGGEYGNFYEKKQQGTTQGRYEVLMGKFNTQLRELGEKMLPMVNTALEWIMRNAERLAMLEDPFKRLLGVLGMGWETFTKLFQALGILNKEGNLSKGFIDALSTAINLLSASLQAFYTVVQGLISFMQRPIFGYDEKQIAEDMRIERRIRQTKASDIMNHASISPMLVELGKNLFPDKKAFSPFIKQPEKADKAGGANSAGLGKAAGLEASVSGAKSSITNINFKSMVGEMKINVETLNEAVGDIEQKILDVLTRVLASGSAIPD